MLAGDIGGQSPLYFVQVGSEVLYGAHAGTLAGETGAEVDLVSLALEVAAPNEWMLGSTRTSYAGVRRLLPGRIARIDSTGVHEHGTTALPAPSKTLEECADALRTALEAAVAARRAERPVRMSSDFSGGIDSTSIAFLALRHVDALDVITFSHGRSPVEDDLVHARRFAGLDTRLRHHVVVGTEEDLPYQVIGDPVDEPTPVVVAHGVDAVNLAVAAAVGSAVHFVGEGGDLVLSAHHNYLLDLAAARRYDVLWRHCVAWARLRSRSPLALFAHVRRHARVGEREGMMQFAALLEGGGRRASRRWEHSAITSWTAPLCDWLARPAREALVAYIHSTTDANTYGHLSEGDRATLSQLWAVNRGYQVQRAAGAQSGVDVHAPYLDTEVVRACFGVESWRKADPTKTKPLLFKALSHRVPHEVLTRRTKGDYTRAAHLGLRRVAPRILAMFDDPLIAQIGLVEPKHVRAAVERAASGLETQWAPLNRVLGVETWLRARSGTPT